MDRKNERLRMVREQIEARGIKDKNIINAFQEVPRHLFVPSQYSDMAYNDCPVPIGEGQTISQPYIVAEMTRLLKIKPKDRVLEIGCGSGYQAAILAFMGADVYTVERINNLIDRATRVLRSLKLDIKITEGDGTLGWPQFAPYNRIIVTASAPEVPEPLLNQLADKGRIVIPVGSRFYQVLKVYEKINGDIKEYDHGGCMFVPLLGRYGWQE
jgi:protein-L-isoaspartate(D-aspartate) O-methyltransferase